MTIVSKSTQGSLYLRNDNRIIAWCRNDRQQAHALVSDTLIFPNHWYHIAATFEANGKIRIYINGVRDNQRNLIGSLEVNDWSLKIGQHPKMSWREFTGQITSVMYSNVVFSDYYIEQEMGVGGCMETIFGTWCP